MTAGIEFRQVTKRYGDAKSPLVVKGVDLVVPKGTLTTILGPSGCGKTTLLRMIAGLDACTGGTILIDGQDVTHLGPAERNVSMVFQSYALFPHMKVIENVAYGLTVTGVGKDEAARRARAAMEGVGLPGYEDRLPSELSGGQQQRVAVARSLVLEPSVMLFDEPLSNLDALLRVELRAHLRAIHRELGFTGIYVTHDQIEAFNLGTRVAVMRAGRIEQLDSASAVYERPATDYVASFLGIRNSIGLRFDDGWTSDAGPLKGNLGMLERRKGPLQLFLRPQALQLHAAGAATEPGHLVLSGGRVVDVLYSGGEVDTVLQFGAVSLFATNPIGSGQFNPGDPVTVSFDSKNALLYHEGKLIRD